MDPRSNGPQPDSDVLPGTDIPTGSDAFKLVMHQLHIHDTWRDAVQKSVQKDVGTKEMDSEKLKCNKKEDSNGDKNGEVRPRTDSLSKLKRFLNINPKPPSSPNSDKRTRGHVSPGKVSPRSPNSPTTPLSPVQRRTHLEVGNDAFRVRAHSDSSAINPRKKKAVLAVAEQTSPLDNLHVHWPDLEQGVRLTTTLRPRSYSSGSGERPTKPILKKSSSRTVYY